MGAENNRNKSCRRSVFARNPLLLVALAIVLTSLCVWLAFHLGADPNLVHAAEIVVAIAVAAVAAWVGLRQRRADTSNASSSGSATVQETPLEDHPSGIDIDSLARTCETLAARFELSQRECDVLVLLAQGMTRQDIEKTLVISMNTVKSHIRHIYQKLNVHSREELEEMLAHAQQ